jgi:hypothetical protein
MARTRDDRQRSLPSLEARESRGDRALTERDGGGIDEDFEHESIFSLFATRKRDGRWDAPDALEATAIFGDVKIDLTTATLPPSGVVEIHAIAVFGQVKVHVPDGSDVEMDGMPVFGSFERKQRAKRASERLREWVTGVDRDRDRAPDDEPPFIRVTGVAVFGKVDVRGR